MSMAQLIHPGDSVYAVLSRAEVSYRRDNHGQCLAGFLPRIDLRPATPRKLADAIDHLVGYPGALLRAYILSTSVRPTPSTARAASYATRCGTACVPQLSS